jgi:Na+/melibiose symporter-like transporter
MSTVTELKRMLTFRPYILLACATILNTSSVQVVQANMELYFKYSYTALESLFSLVILILLGCAVLFVPIWKYFMQKIDKKYLFMIGNVTMVPLLLGGFFFGSGSSGEIALFFSLAILAANCFTAVFLIPWAMLPEVLDAYFIKYKTKPDAFFYTFFTLGSKVIMALYFGLTQIVLG